MRAHPWPARASLPLEALEVELHRCVLLDMPYEALAAGNEAMIKAVLKKLGETKIAEHFAAMFYALSAHGPWREVALRVLLPGSPPLSDVYQRVAALVRTRHPEIPLWLAGGLVVSVHVDG